MKHERLNEKCSNNKPVGFNYYNSNKYLNPVLFILKWKSIQYCQFFQEIQ